MSWDRYERRTKPRENAPGMSSEESLRIGYGKLSAEYKGQKLQVIFNGLLAILIALVLLMNWWHKDDMKEATNATHNALNEALRAIQFQTCLNSMPIEYRLKELQIGDFCANMANYRVPRPGDR